MARRPGDAPSARAVTLLWDAAGARNTPKLVLSLDPDPDGPAKARAVLSEP